MQLRWKKKKKISAVYGEGAVTDWTCPRLFGKFCAVDFLLDAVPRLGGPVEVDSDQIETNWEQTTGVVLLWLNLHWYTIINESP